MGLAVALIVIALIIGGLALVVAALKWALILAVALIAAGVIVGWLRRATAA